MAIESTYNAVTDPVSGQRIRLILTPGGGPGGTGQVNVEDFANGTLIAEAIDAYMRLILLAGAGITIDTSDPGNIEITATGGGSYTAENARDDIAAALLGESSYLVVTPSDGSDTITLTIDPAFKARVVALENARSLVQVKENSGTGGSGNYMSLPGTSGNAVSTPSNNAFSPAGDMSIVARIMTPSSAPAGDITIEARNGGTNAQLQFRFTIKNTGHLSLLTTIDGVATSNPTTTTGTPPIAFDGSILWVRVSRQSSDGTTDFYTAADTGSNATLPPSWDTIQLARSSTAGALWSNGGALSQQVEVGSSSNGGSLLYQPRIYRSILYHDINATGSIILDCNASDYTTGTTWNAPGGYTWTLNGTASIVLSGGGATFSTAAKFVLGDTDAFGGIALAHKDILYWFSQGGLINTSGSSATFTPELVVNNVILSTMPAITIASSASNVYRYECALTVEISASGGTTQVYAWTFRVYNAATGTFVGSATTSTVHTDMGGGHSVALTTLTSVPKIELKMTHSVSNAGVGSGMTNSRLSLQKA